MNKKSKIQITLALVVIVFLTTVLIIFFPRKLVAPNEEMEWEQIVIFREGEMIYLEDVLDDDKKTELEQLFRRYTCRLTVQNYEEEIGDEEKEDYFFMWQTFQYDVSRAQWMLHIVDDKACRSSFGKYTYKIYNEAEFVEEVEDILEGALENQN